MVLQNFFPTNRSPAIVQSLASKKKKGECVNTDTVVGDIEVSIEATFPLKGLSFCQYKHFFCGHCKRQAFKKTVILICSQCNKKK